MNIFSSGYLPYSIEEISNKKETFENVWTATKRATKFAYVTTTIARPSFSPRVFFFFVVDKELLLLK
jgi:hypothetical protein